MRGAVGFLAGGLFGLGLVLSDMVNPARVLAFLDVAGAWDPTLGFVMAGALAPMALAWRVAARRRAAGQGGWCPGTALPGAPPAAIDRRLIGGAALFGLGWGLVGLCPGPSLAILAMGDAKAVGFWAAMVAGMLLAGRTGAAATVPAPAR